MTQHTPGPWSINEWPQPDSSIGVGAAGTTLIARVILQQKANALLIAAAPLLLAAAKQLIAQHDAPFRAPDYCQCTHCAPLRAAIAKAEG